MMTAVDAICADCAVLEAYLGNDTSLALILELVRFLMLKALFRDMDASLLSPSLAVDTAWHALLQHPKLYNSVCDRLLPADIAHPFRVLDHNPAGKTCAQRQMRYRRTHARYLEVFNEAPPEEYWPVSEMNSSSSGSSSGASVLGKRPCHEVHPVAEPDAVIRILLQHGRSDEGISVRPSTSIGKLRMAIALLKNTPHTGIRLMFDGKNMNYDLTVSAYDIKEGDTLDLMYEQGGC